MGQTIKRIFTHENPHVDEILAIWLLLTFGGKKYSGVQSATIKVTPVIDFELQPGDITIGIGGGKFDEHPDGDKGRKIGDCSATLVARDLGIENNPIIAPLLDYVCRNDLNGARSMMELGSIVKTLNFYHTDQSEVFVISFKIFEAEFKKQKEFLSAANELKNAELVDVVWKEENCKVVFANTQNREFSSFVRSQHGRDIMHGKALLVVQRNHDGYTQIFGDKRSGFPLSSVAKAIRLAEIEKRGIPLPSSESTELMLEKTRFCPEWYFHAEAGFLLNGSLSIREQEPTCLSLEEIEEVIKSVL